MTGTGLWQAGPELDLSVHERVFQLGRGQEIHPYSRNEGWAGSVIHRMRELGWEFAETRTDEVAGTRYTARFDRESALDDPTRRSWGGLAAPSRPLAICIAAVTALQAR